MFSDRHFGFTPIQQIRDLCKIPICGEFLRCALLARLPIYLICLHSLCCYASNFIHIWVFCKGLNLLADFRFLVISNRKCLSEKYFQTGILSKLISIKLFVIRFFFVNSQTLYNIRLLFSATVTSIAVFHMISRTLRLLITLRLLPFRKLNFRHFHMLIRYMI